MKKYFLLLAVLSILLSCKSTKESKASADLKLEKIIFSTSSCFGRCPSFQFELTSNQQIKLRAKAIYDRRGIAQPNRQGYFTGIANQTAYQKLLVSLRKIGLDTVKFGGPDCCDGPSKTIIVYYNGKRKYLHAMFPPEYGFDLISSLQNVYETTSFTRSERSFEIEQDSIPKMKKNESLSPKHQE